MGNPIYNRKKEKSKKNITKTFIPFLCLMSTTNFISDSAYIGVLLTISSYGIGLWLNKKTGISILNPLLTSIILTTSFLVLAGISYESYNEDVNIINFFLTPSTICLAIPLYEQIHQIKKNPSAIGIGITSGVLASIFSIFGMSLLFGLDHTSYVTLLPKSITTAIGMGVSEELGGIVPVTIMSIVCTGIIGNIFAEKFLRIIKIKNPIAKGIAIGSASHVIGTSKAMEMGQTEGAMSSLAIVTSGIITVIAASVFSTLI